MSNQMNRKRGHYIIWKTFFCNSDARGIGIKLYTIMLPHTAARDWEERC